jgi:hypothetical protein
MRRREFITLPSLAASNIVVINARCSLQIEADRRVVVVAGLPVHHYRAEDAVAEAYAMVLLVEGGFARQTDAMAQTAPGRLCQDLGQPDVARWSASLAAAFRQGW